jgi:hypothetical protein
MFIYMAFVLPTLIFKPFNLQNYSNAFIIYYKPSLL